MPKRPLNVPESAFSLLESGGARNPDGRSLPGNSRNFLAPLHQNYNKL